jgi:hypothetical protein
MKKILSVLTILSSVVILSGCTGNAVYMRGDKSYKETDPNTVKVYASTMPLKNFEAIGYVSTYTSNADRAGDDLREKLKIQAAKYGANAIIGFKLNIGMGGGGGAQGVAIRFTE